MKQRLIRKVRLMASSIYNIIKSMYTEIQNNTNQIPFDQSNYKVMDYSQNNGNQNSGNQSSGNQNSGNQGNGNQSNGNQNNGNQSNGNQSTNNLRNYNQSGDNKSNDNLKNYNQSKDDQNDYYSGYNKSTSSANQSNVVSNARQNEIVKKLQNAIIMAEILSPPVCRTRGYKRNTRNTRNR